MDTYWQCTNGVDFAQLTCPQSGPFESREEDDIVLDNFRTNRHPVGESVMFGPFFVKTRHHRRHHHHHRRHEHREIRVPTYTEDAFEGRIPKEIKSNPFFDGRNRNRVEVEDVLDKRPGQLTDSIFKFFPATKRSDRRRDDKSHKSHKKHKKSNSDEVEGSGTDSGMESGDDDGDNVVETKALRLIG
ncbi:unnamed protein product, partial [Mesorhabditis spiculigera]